MNTLSQKGQRIAQLRAEVFCDSASAARKIRTDDVPASEKQIAFLRDLIAAHNYGREQAITQGQADVHNLPELHIAQDVTKREATEIINMLEKDLRRDEVFVYANNVTALYRVVKNRNFERDGKKLIRDNASALKATNYYDALVAIANAQTK